MNQFEKNNINLYGEAAKKWVNKLATITASIESKYQLNGLTPVANMSYNYVLSGYQKKTPIIVKIGLDVEGLKREADALDAFARCGACQVIAKDKGVLILKRAMPGNTLSTHFPENEDDAIATLCSMIKKLHQADIPKDHSFPHIKDWLKTLDNDLPIPIAYLKKARNLRDQLLATSEQTILLHGDLHHDNILDDGQSWMIIDPKGVIGCPVYEVAAFIRNPIPSLLTHENPQAIIAHRIKKCAKLLGCAEKKIIDWFYVQAVLSWAWQIEDNLSPSYFKKLMLFI
jgi:streptomycin 6-kinase